MSTLASPLCVGSWCVAAGASSGLWDGLRSVAQECVVLLVFFATWSLTRSGLKTPKVDPAKAQADPKYDPVQKAKVIQELCADQFTRALRMYRELVKREQDTEIRDEGFYLSLVEASVRCGKADVAVQMMLRMKTIGLELTSGFLLSVFKMLSARKLYTECLDVYKQFGAGPKPEPLTFAVLILGAADLGDLALAKGMVEDHGLGPRESLPIARACVRTGDSAMAVSLVRSFMARGVVVENILLNTALAACAKEASAAPLMRELLDEVLAWEQAHKVEITDIVSYNTLMKALARATKPADVEGCFALLETLLLRGVKPDGVTFSTILDVCIREDQHDAAIKAMERMQHCGVAQTTVLMTTLMKGFVKSQRLDKAFQLYRSMQAGVQPDIVTYSLLIKACCDAGEMDQALSVLEDMLQAGCRVDDVVFTHLIDGCCAGPNVELAEQLLRDMVAARVQPTVYSITGLIKVYGKSGLSEKAVALVSTMEATYNVKPTVVVYTCVVSGLLRNRKHGEAYAAFQQLMEKCELDTHCVQTMLYGLADAMMWTQFNDIAAQFLARGVPPISPDCLNHGLHLMAKKEGMQSARVLYKIMNKYGVEVQEPLEQKLKC